jgi:DNA-binding GntR family transcriptional regulator
MKLQKTVSRAESVYQLIKDKIMYGDFEPGMLLNEGGLAADLNVSKTPVREALNRLKYENLVDVVPYRGYFVTNLSARELRDLIELRIIMETSAAELAIKRATESQIKHLISLAEKGFENIESEEARKKFLEINADFHCYIAEMSGNQRIMDLTHHVTNQLQRVLFLDLKEYRISRMKEEHLEIAQMIEQRNTASVREVVLRHLQDSQARILNLL